MTMFEPLLCPSRLDFSLLARGTMKLDPSVPTGDDGHNPGPDPRLVRGISMGISLILLVGFEMKENAWRTQPRGS
jgi:hypothetical protein